MGKRSPDDDGFDAGDLTVAEISEPKRRPQRGRALPWLLFVLLLLAVVAFALQIGWPMYERLQEAESMLEQTRLANTQLDSEVGVLEASREELARTRAELAEELLRKQQAIDALQAAQEELAAKLHEQVNLGNISIHQKQGQLVVDLADRILFDSGAAELNASGQGVLREVASSLSKLADKVIEVGGHSDAVPISPKLLDKFPSNWELASARATHVVRFLQDECGIAGERLVAAGFAQYRPVASNKSVKGRKRNRRIELTLQTMPANE